MQYHMLEQEARVGEYLPIPALYSTYQQSVVQRHTFVAYEQPAGKDVAN